MTERTVGWESTNPPTDSGPQPELMPDLTSPRHVEPGTEIGTETDERSTGDVAKEQAGDLKDSAADAGRHVADVAKDQAQQVAGEAGRTAKDLLDQGRAELEEQASTQQVRAAAGLHSIGSELRSLANGSTETGLVVDLAREAGNRAESLAHWLETRQPADVLEDVRSFARQRPGTFLALAATAGAVSARLARGIQAGPPAKSAPSPKPTNGVDPHRSAPVAGTDQL